MDGQGNEDHTKKQFHRRTLRRGQKCKPFHWSEEANDGAFWKLEPFSKALEQDSERACKGVEGEDGGGYGIAISASLPMDSAFDDSPISNSLDLTSSFLYSMVVISKEYLIRD